VDRTQAQSGAPSAICLREMLPGDIPQLSEVHLTAAREPTPALRNYYADKFSLYLRHPDSTVIVAAAGSQVAGFVALTANNASFIKHCRRPRSLLQAALRMLLGRYGFSPRRLRDHAAAVVQRLRAGHDDPALQGLPLPAAWIDSLHVAPDWRRMGIATRLLDAAERWLGQRNAKAVAVYAEADSVAAREVYGARGYQVLAELSRVGVGKAWIMAKTLADQPLEQTE